MSLVLQPQATFVVVRQIANHTDTATYYVRAVVRNAYTDTVITNLDLEDKGSQRFKKNWHVPADPSGQGFYISIVTSVYTDSGYTTKSENYGDEENTYLIQERVLGSQKVGGGGGVDARTVRRIISEEIAKIEVKPEKEVEPEMEEDDDPRVDELITEVQRLRNAVEQLPKEPVTLSPVLARLNDVIQAVEDKEVTPPTDIEALGVVFDSKLNEFLLELEQTRAELLTTITDVGDTFNTNMKTAVVEAVTEATPNAMKGASFSVPMQLNPPQQEKKQEPAFNINQLAR